MNKLTLPANSAESERLLEQLGIPPAQWYGFLKATVDQGINIHSVLLGSSTLIAAQANCEELNDVPLHRLFSVSKSFTAMAIGALIGEGKLGLEDKLIDYYPEYASLADLWMRQTTIRNLLMMESNHEVTTYKQRPDTPWVESFFTTASTHCPGTTFIYDTSASHVLANLVERISGMKLLTYLRALGLSEVGLSDEAYFIKDPQGSPMGGSGLMASAKDMYCLAAVLMNGGRFGERALFPAEYVKEATSFMTSTAQHEAYIEESYGYGYQIWQHRRGWWFNGMGAQFAIAVPDRDLLLVLTADVQKRKSDLQRVHDNFHDFIVEQSRISTVEKPLDLKLPRASGVPSQARGRNVLADFCGRWSLVSTGGVKAGLCITQDNVNILNFAVNIGDKTLVCQASDDGQARHKLAPNGHLAFGSLALQGQNRLQALIQVIDEEVGTLDLYLALQEGGRITFRMRNTIESAYGEWKGLFNGNREV